MLNIESTAKQVNSFQFYLQNVDVYLQVEDLSEPGFGGIGRMDRIFLSEPGFGWIGRMGRIFLSELEFGGIKELTEC